MQNPADGKATGMSPFLLATDPCVSYGLIGTGLFIDQGLHDMHGSLEK